MPIYNGIEFIDESVSTILYQTYKEWELIIGINGHQPNSDVYQLAKKYELRDQRIKVYDLPENIKGKSAALNEMLNLCSSESKWISLLDVDDKWSPKKLESQLPFISEYDVIGTMCKYFGDSNIVPQLPCGDISNFNFELSISSNLFKIISSFSINIYYIYYILYIIYYILFNF